MSIYGNISKKNNEDNLIGTVNFSVCVNEDSAGSVSFGGHKGLGKIYVYTDEGRIPHCHIIFTGDKEKDCCIALISANYFVHPNKDNKLNTNEMKQFVKWCKEYNKKYSDMGAAKLNNWQAMKYLWNKNRTNKEMPSLNVLDENIPEYYANMPEIKEK